MNRNARVLSGFLPFSFLFAFAATAAARELPGIDALASAPPRAAAPLAASVRTLVKPATSVRYEERLGVPTFVWLRADGAAPVPSVAGKGNGAEAAGRSALATFALLYGLDPADVASAVVVDVHDTGRGPIIARFRQRIGGIEVFREEIKVLMDRSLRPVALAGYVSGAGELARSGEGQFTLGAARAVAAAVGDYAGAAVSGDDVASAGPAKGGYDYFDLGGPAQLAGSVVAIEPIRAKPVYFHLPSGMVAAYYVELNLGTPGSGDSDYYAYVVAAADGRVLYRNNLTVDANNPYTYRVWADTTGLLAPFDGPQGNGPTPLPSALPNAETFPYVLQNDVTVSSLVGIGVNDAWLPAGATETNGNNVDAYANVGAPDGFTPGVDFRADVTAPGEFLRTHDPSLEPNVNVGQQKAAVTQLFYDLNFLHDWFYVSGFDEQSGNAQASNYGRGGLEADSIKAQAQDFSGINNANMSTPADGARPRMRMYLFTNAGTTTISVATQSGPPVLPASNTFVGTAAFGPSAFDTGVLPIVRAVPNNGCTAIGAAVAGSIAFIDRGTCNFDLKVKNAQDAGALGAIIANVSTSGNPTVAPGMAAGSPPQVGITIGALSLNFANGEDFRAHFTAGDPLTGRLTRVPPSPASLDGTIDNQIVAHEWGHYLSNRLIGNASGLGNNVGRGMGEGWSDFIAMLMSVKEEDSLVASNLTFEGVYAMAGYATPAFSNPSNPYYFGIRRYPYSTTTSKNPLTFKHISDVNALPPATVAPVNLNSSFNSEVHNTGEVWANMLWECYASLLRDTLGGSPRLSFAEAQSRMKDYIVASYKATPMNPTMLEARDALLAAAYLNDPVDFLNFTQAFAKRGAGVHAISADRFAADNTPVVESFVAGAALAATSMSVADDGTTCGNADGVLDNGETGTLTFTFHNVGNAAVGATVNVSSTTAGITFPDGPTMTVASTNPFGSTTATIKVAASGLTGITPVDITVDIPPLAGIPVTQTFSFLANYDDFANQTATDDAESPATQWTNAYGTGSDTSTSWQRVAASITDHHYNGPDPGAPADVSFVSPLLSVGSGPFSIGFKHRFAFEVGGGLLFDGGVIELTADGGATWTDVGLLLTGASAYTGALALGGDNPLEGRLAFSGMSAGYPAYNPVTLNLGTTYANKTVRLRFRVGSDTNTGAAGWDIDDIAFTGLLNTPFHALVPQPAVCNNAPIAAAGTGFTVNEFGPAPTFAPVTVTLDGSASLDPDGNPITFLWTQTAGPAASLSSATAMQPTFTAPQVPRTPASTVLTFQLVVNDGTQSSAPSLVNITVVNVNRPPTANAGPPQTVNELTTVTLVGSGSADPDAGDVLIYGWSQTAGPPVTLSGGTTVSPTFTAPDVLTDTTLTFRLIVNDGLAQSAPSTVNILVQNVPPASTTTVLAASPSPATFGQVVTLTATVTSSGGTPGGSVTFKEGATTLGTGTLNGSGVASFSTSTFALGDHTLTAEYGGALTFVASTSAPVTLTVGKAAAGPNDFYTVTPCRLVDTRAANGPLGGPPLTPQEARVFNLAGTCAIPPTAVAISINVTVVAPGATGFVRILPSDSGASTASTLNFGAGQIRSNNAVVAISNDVLGGVSIKNGSNGALNVVVDVNGYFQ